MSSPAQASANTTKTKTTTYNINCNTTLGNASEQVTTTVVYPASVVHGTKFTYKWTSKTLIAKSQDQAAWTAGGRSFKGTVKVIDHNHSDATPKSANVAGSKGIATGGALVGPPNYGPAYVYTPLTKGTYSTTPSFTAGAKGTDTVTPGVDDATLTLYNSSGIAVLTVTANCSAPSTKVVLASIAVT